ncbi:cytochrome P450 [Phytohabitans flavus]|uniref:cytochrome P450 n=1 Tax=Phytohabitans flavus TaxID=1076124 RepID=UPI0039E95FB4
MPIHRTLPRLIRDPFGALQAIAEEADGEVVRLELGWFRPYLVTNPDHVQHVLRDNVDNYVRDGQGLFWRPIRRLLGEGILADGPVWEASRRNLQPLFSAKHVESLVDSMADMIAAAVDDLDRYAREGTPIDAGAEMSRIVHLTVIKVFFRDRITVEQAERMVPALDTIATSIAFRLLLPFVPNAVPLPGDRAFRRAVRTIDEIVFPIVRECRRDPGDGDDIVATLCRARGADGQPLTEQQVRDDVVTMFGAATETTGVLLTWLWPVLQAHPEVAGRLYAEVDQVVGSDRVRREHLAGLGYTRMVLDELLRLYPSGWLFPRTAVAGDVIGGVRLRPRATVLISPFLTQRLDAHWADPLEFRPDRFEPGVSGHVHRYAYFPFGGGPHQCIGKHVFLVEAQLIVAAMLSRFRPRLASQAMPGPQVAASLRPASEVRMTLLPVQRTLAA